ncbi:MAG: glycosyltransferase, partial [Prolixibacteraceae bacterium]|nr:glycosyltransferase [Prolixibacteraceae bacterium]
MAGTTMEVKFSIGIPAFKGKYLKDSISSVLSQSFTSFELIIINDCSPDPVKEIVSG